VVESGLAVGVVVVAEVEVEGNVEPADYPA
jgi:hypothetical protein